MPLIDIERLDDPLIDEYRGIRDAELWRERGLFVVEGRGTLRVLVDRSPFAPRSLLLGRTACSALEDVLARIDPAVPVYRAAPEILEGVAGFAIHRGCLALVERPPDHDLDRLLAGLPPGPSRLVALEGLSNHDNVGGIFRNAMAFAVDGVLLCPRCCDPLYRKAIRTSMGGSLCVPFARATPWPGALGRLRDAGYAIVALDPAAALRIEEAEPLPARAVLVVGTEGAGLSEEVRSRADLALRIDMAEGVDSLNVATAAAVALHRLFSPGGSAR